MMEGSEVSLMPDTPTNVIASRIDHLHSLPYEQLKNLCNSGGMSDAVFASLKIPPGEWWLCYSADNEPCCAKMQKNIELMLQKFPSVTPSEVNHDVSSLSSANIAEYWLELHRKLDGLHRMHYKALQKICYSGQSNAFFHEISDVLHISSEDWIELYETGEGCRDTMANDINTIFAEKMRSIRFDKFTQIIPKDLPFKRTKTSDIITYTTPTVVAPGVASPKTFSYMYMPCDKFTCICHACQICRKI